MSEQQVPTQTQLSAGFAWKHVSEHPDLFYDGDAYLVAIEWIDRRGDRYWSVERVVSHCDTETPVYFNDNNGDAWGNAWDDVIWWVKMSDVVPAFVGMHNSNGD